MGAMFREGEPTFGQSDGHDIGTQWSGCHRKVGEDAG